jgi:medium-chain acyl-[acyl-carrier-protein] hydrolase
VLEHREFMAVLLPMLRADFTLVEDYRPRNRGPLRSPITVFGGADDRLIAAEQLLAWSQETTAACDVHIVPGGHFFLESARLEMLDIIRRVWVS